jgi:hypothetical protein
MNCFFYNQGHDGGGTQRSCAIPAGSRDPNEDASPHRSGRIVAMRVHASGTGLRLALALGFLAALPAAGASLRVQGFSQATNDPDFQDLVDETAPIGPLAAGATSAGVAASGGGSASGEVSAEADYGVLRARAIGTASGPFLDPGNAVAGGSIEAAWTDRFTIQPADPDLLLQDGTFVLEMTLDGSLTADAGGASQSNTRAQYNLTVEAGTCSPGCNFKLVGEQSDFGLLGGGQTFEGDPVADFKSPPVPFVFGVPIDLSVELSAVAQAVAAEEPVTSSADADPTHTLVWNGLSEVRNASQGLVTDFSVISDSGVDWSRPVPEPSSELGEEAALLGLAALRGVARGGREARPAPLAALSRTGSGSRLAARGGLDRCRDGVRAGAGDSSEPS